MRREAEDGAAVEWGGGGRGGVHDNGEGRHGARDGAAPAVEVALRSLYGAPPSLMAQVKKLNLGILPVQCPPLCYKRAVNSDRAQLSHAALLQTMSKAAEDATEEIADAMAEERSAKRVKIAVTPAEHGEDHSVGKDATGKVVGALLAEHDLIHRVVHIQTLAVDARHRRLGVGRQLVERVLERASSLDRVTCVQLHVHVANDDALAFYQRMGFVQYQRIENYYRHLTPRTCLVLRRDMH